ncbi:MAG: hypothetical protein HYZ21_10145 [Chloroflexi bacterium]|nr:hypothetical protein [Chloroflexota bacterium]
MTTEMVIIPKGMHNILRRLTGQSRPDIALSLAIKDLIRLRIETAEARIAAYEQKYGMQFPEFERAWKNGEIKDPYSYPVEQDYMQWETAIADLGLLQEMLQWQA